MSRPIDADKLKSYFAPTLTGRTEYSADEILLTIATMPTVDAEPVKRGHWLAVKGWDDDLGELDSAECSVCHETQESEYWAKTYYKYCPNCGAKMDEVDA